MLRTTIIAAVTATALPAIAQDSYDTMDFHSVDDMKVVNANGDKLGEVDEILVDKDGKPAAYVVDTGGFLDIGDEDVIVKLDALEWTGDGYKADMTEDELKSLRKWDD